MHAATIVAALRARNDASSEFMACSSCRAHTRHAHTHLAYVSKPGTADPDGKRDASPLRCGYWCLAVSRQRSLCARRGALTVFRVDGVESSSVFIAELSSLGLVTEESPDGGCASTAGPPVDASSACLLPGYIGQRGAACRLLGAHASATWHRRNPYCSCLPTHARRRNVDSSSGTSHARIVTSRPSVVFTGGAA